MYPNHGQYYQAPYQPPHGYGHPPQAPHPLPAPTEGAPKKKLSTGAKWAIGIGAFLAFGALGGAELAREALKTRDLTFARWCA